MNADIFINDINVFNDVKLQNVNRLTVTFSTKIPVTSVMADYLYKRGACMNFHECRTFVVLPMKDVEIVFK